ncbi:MAG: stage III sporulation protein AE [Firmicutes bacterium]|nr:stage III sporulation protein AE [Bacillota bacterium]
MTIARAPRRAPLVAAVAAMALCCAVCAAITVPAGVARAAAAAGNDGAGSTGSGRVGPPGVEGLVQGQAARLDDGEFQRLLDQLYRDTAGYAPEIRWRDVVSEVSRGRPGVDVTAIMRGLGEYLFRETMANSRLLGRLVILAVAAALLENIGSAFERRGVADLAKAACYLVLVVLAAGSFIHTMSAARKVIADMVTMMKALLPTLIALVAASGGPVSAGLLKPAIIATVYAVSVITSDYVLPMLMLAAVIDLAGHVVKQFRISGVASLLRQASALVLGLSLATFLGMVAVNKAAGSVADGVALRSAKFLSGTFVPVVGKMFSDAAEMVFASSYLLRSAVGIAGAAAVIVTVAYPLCKVLSLIIIYRVAAALMQPIGADTLGECLNSIANALTFMSAAAGSVAIMFVLAITALAVAANPV